MAQLSDDCFAFGGPLMSVDAAVEIITSRVTAVRDAETVALSAADGRVLARDMVAPLPLPPFTNSAVDGYAVRGDDLPTSGERAVPVSERVQAGAAACAPIAPGRAVRIFTGAPMPEGADTVFMQEDVRIDATGQVVLPAGLKRGANVRPAGEDVQEGQVALQAGHRLRPQDVALAAAFGLTELDVVRRIRVAVFSTGNELASPGTPRAAAQALKQVAGDHDLILTTGGVSTGEEDHVRTSVQSAGSLVLWRMAIKPGRPVAMGIIDGTAFIGLPGNPVASFVTFVHVVRPTILALAGAPAVHPVAMPVRAAFTYKKKTGRREYVRASLRRDPDGTLEAVKFPREGAGLLSSLVETDGLVELGEAVAGVEPGQTVGFLAYADLM